MPGGLRTHLSWHAIRGRLRAAIAKFSSLPPAPPARRRAILTGSLVAAGISFLVSLSIVTAFELGVGKSLSCWLWEDCPAAESLDEDGTSTSTTLPSILGGGQSVPSDAAAVQPPSPPQQPPPAFPQQPASESPQQSTPRVPGVASPPEGVQGSSEQPSSSQPGQESSPSVVSEEGNQRPNSSEGSEAGKQASGSEEPQQREDQKSQSSSGSDRQSQELPFPPVPWTT
jgi:hypothetical protein